MIKAKVVQNVNRMSEIFFSLCQYVNMTACQIDFWGLKKTSLNWSRKPKTFFTWKFFLVVGMSVVLKKFEYHNHRKIISGSNILICPKTWFLTPYNFFAILDVIELIMKTTKNYLLRLKPNTLYIIAEFQFQSLISILTARFDFLKNSEPLTRFKLYFMTRFSLTVPGHILWPSHYV